MSGTSLDLALNAPRRRSCAINLSVEPRPTARNQTDAVNLTDKVCFLSRSENYAEQPNRVEVIETHYSWVFLTDQHAYKLKKPVQGCGFDFRSIEERRRNALAELHLNRRLAPSVYIGVLPLTCEVDGRLKVAGLGVPVDWLVKMRRLDANEMLDGRIARGNWHHAELEALAHRLAGFFATARRVQLTFPQLLARIRAELGTTVNAFEMAGEPQLRTAAERIARRLEAFLRRRGDLLRQRIRSRRLVDGHGDLRPEHVYLKGEPCIIDCLEFRADLRELDPVSELAYLALECRRLGGPDITRRLLRRYRSRTRDKAPPEILRFYTGFNALVRARIAVQHLSEPGTRTSKEWANRAVAYLEIGDRESRLLTDRLAAN